MRLLSLALALMCDPSWATDERAAQVFVVPSGTRLTLPQGEDSAMVGQIGPFFASCSLDSEGHPGVFAEHQPGSDWDTAAKHPHLYARLWRPLSVTRANGRVRVTEALIPLDAAAPYWYTRDGGAVVLWTKCTWPAMRHILCSASVLPHLTRASREQCATLK